MNNWKNLCIISVLFLLLLIAVPVLAATVTCPSGCSCLLPAEAKKAGYTGYCNGKQAICGYDALKNEKYCYEMTKTTTTTIKPVVTTTATTAPVPESCPTGCSCYTLDDGKANGLSLCGDSKTLCGYSLSQEPMYCHAVPATTLPLAPVQAVTATPVPTYPVTVLMTPVITLATPTTSPVLQAPARCMISGNIYDFWANSSTLRISVTRSGGTTSYVAVAPVMSNDLVSHFRYTAMAACDGTYELEPVYHAVPGACAWSGTFSPSRGTTVVMDGESQSGWDFTYNPDDNNIPEADITSTPPLPGIDEDIRISVWGRDDAGIAGMSARVDYYLTDGTRLPSTSHALVPEPVLVTKAGALPTWSDRFEVTTDDLDRIEVTARVCDTGGNERSAFATIRFGSCDDYTRNRDEQQIDCGGTYCGACIPCTWCDPHVIPLRIEGSPSDKIDVIFIPDNDYGGDFATFRSDVQDTIINGYLENEAIERNISKFNFYYLDDEADITAYPACGFTPPLDSCANFQDATTFADSLPVVHQTDFRDWSGEACGRRIFCSEPTSYRTFVHESGHSVFGLKDEYCCDSHYSQNNPMPNIWSTRNNCRNDASGMGWNQDDCSNFCSSGSGNCGSGFWDIDPAHCIMACSQSCSAATLVNCGAGGNPMCQFEQACERRVDYVFSQYP